VLVRACGRIKTAQGSFVGDYPPRTLKQEGTNITSFRRVWVSVVGLQKWGRSKLRRPPRNWCAQRGGVRGPHSYRGAGREENPRVEFGVLLRESRKGAERGGGLCGSAPSMNTTSNFTAYTTQCRLRIGKPLNKSLGKKKKKRKRSAVPWGPTGLARETTGLYFKKKRWGNKLTSSYPRGREGGGKGRKQGKKSGKKKLILEPM